MFSFISILFSIGMYVVAYLYLKQGRPVQELPVVLKVLIAVAVVFFPVAYNKQGANKHVNRAN